MIDLKNIALGIAISALLPLTVYVGTELITPEPSCPQYRHLKSRDQEEERILYSQHLKKYKETLFYTSITTGLTSIFLGALILTIPFLNFGLIIGGTVTLIMGYIINWQELDTVLKFSSLLLGLLILILSSIPLARLRFKNRG